MKKLFVVFAAALATAAIAVTPALAGTVFWTQGQGTFGPCDEGETAGLHWVFTPGGNDSVTSATLTVNGSEVLPMSPSGGGSWSADSSGATEPTSAKVDFVGDLGNGNANLVISHGCFGESTTTGGTTGETTGTTTGETTGTTTGETTGTTGTTTGTTGTTGTTTGGTTGTGGVSGSTTGGTTGGTASTPSGGNLPFTGLPVWMPLLAAAAMLGSGVFLVRRRKGEVS
jgi:hypothetical protein